MQTISHSSEIFPFSVVDENLGSDPDLLASERMARLAIKALHILKFKAESFPKLEKELGQDGAFRWSVKVAFKARYLNVLLSKDQFLEDLPAVLSKGT
jgi:hypothetical protein